MEFCVMAGKPQAIHVDLFIFNLFVKADSKAIYSLRLHVKWTLFATTRFVFFIMFSDSYHMRLSMGLLHALCS